MTSGKALISAIAATTAMTIFSYMVSRQKRRNFREPELLAAMADDLLASNDRFLARPIGWSGHYLVGCILGTTHLRAMRKAGFAPTIGNGLVTGPVYGLLATLVWEMHFSTHPNPPKINYLRFYGHLILAHTIFTVVTNKVYSALNNDTDKQHRTKAKTHSLHRN